LSGFACNFSSNLRSKGGGFTRTTEALTTTSGPGQCITLTIGNCHNGVIKRSVNMRHTFRNGTIDLFPIALIVFCHLLASGG